MEGSPEPEELNTQQHFMHQTLMAISGTLQNLAFRSNTIKPSNTSKTEKSTPLVNLDNQEFLTWEKENYSVIQVHVLDQFLTIEKLANQETCSFNNSPQLNTFFQIKTESDNIPPTSPVTLSNYSCDILKIEAIQKTLQQKIKTSDIHPLLNIGGGEESCGYQAVKNALLLSQHLDHPLLYSALNDPIYANKLFGTMAINTLLNDLPSEQGPWRQMVIDHRIALGESSLHSIVESTQKIVLNIEADLKKIPGLIEIFEKSSTEVKRSVLDEMQSIWENILKQESNISSQATNAEQKSSDIGTVQAKELATIAAEIALKTKKHLQDAKKIIPSEALKPKTRSIAKDASKTNDSEDDNYYDPDDYDPDDYGYNDYDDDDYNFDDEEENDSDEEGEGSYKEEEKLPVSSSLNLEQSEKEGNNLDVSDLDYLYDTLKESYTLPESTTIGTAELGTEPLENQGTIELETAETYFDRIITDMTKNGDREHIIFVGGGGHWATVLIRIINNKLYYIIADSTNEQRYGVDLKRKGIFITKAIQKIIDGTKDSLLKLVN